MGKNESCEEKFDHECVCCKPCRQWHIKYVCVFVTRPTILLPLFL